MDERKPFRRGQDDGPAGLDRAEWSVTEAKTPVPKKARSRAVWLIPGRGRSRAPADGGDSSGSAGHPAPHPAGFIPGFGPGSPVWAVLGFLLVRAAGPVAG